MPGSDASAPLAVDHSLGGRYRLIGPIARGGMAEVWEGHDEILSRPVAVKVLLSHLATDQVVRERFRREAVTAARLAHPHVVATYDTGLDNGIAYIVMELVRGQTLRHLLAAKGSLPVPVAVSVADQIADALAHAHRAGLVHRDIKPANVLLADEDGPLPRIKVTDFGIAKAAESVGVDLTSTGMVLGTPKYLSPEQVEGREPDARADLYSLGVVLYEMLAGEPPFSGPTEMATALAHLRDRAPSVSSRRGGIPAALDQVVAVLLAKDPGDRYVSATELRRALAGVSRPGGGATPPGGAYPPAGPLPLLHAGRPTPGGSFAADPPTTVHRRAPTGGPDGMPPTGVLPSGRRGAPPRADRTASAATRTGPAATSAIAGTLGHGSTSTARNGSVPGRSGPPTARNPPVGPATHWPQGAPDPSRSTRGLPPAPPKPRRRRRRRGPGIVVVALVLAGGVLAAVLLTSTSGGGTGPSAGAQAPVSLKTAQVFILAGHSPDDPSGAVNVLDNNPATVWQTDTYSTSHFGNLYPGIGLAVQVNGSPTLHRMTVVSPAGGWSAESYVSPTLPTTATGVGVWGAPTDTKTATGTTTSFSLGGKAGSWVLLWLTSTGGPPYRAAIGDISIS